MAKRVGIVRRILGDLECPLKSESCSSYDAENRSCTSLRGRLDDGSKAPCYNPMKIEIRRNKEGIVGRILYAVVEKYLEKD